MPTTNGQSGPVARRRSGWIAIAAATLLLAACGGEESDPAPPPEETALVDPAPEEPAALPEPEPVPEPAPEPEPAPAPEPAPEPEPAPPPPGDETTPPAADPIPEAVAAEAPPADTETPPAANPAEVATEVTLLTGDIGLDDEMLALLETADPDRGQSYIQRCTGCHSFREEGPGATGPLVGPPLFGIFEGPVANADNFDYTPAFEALAETGLIWDAAHLNAFLTDPEGTVPGTGMTIGGIADPENRANVIAFLQILVPSEGAFADAADPELAARIDAADPADGELLAARCTTCHRFEEGAEVLVGPTLFNIVGAPVARHEGFAYTPAMQALNADGATWTDVRLDEFLANPAIAVPGTRMGFGGIDDADDRAAIIAYLRSISPDAPGLAAEEILGIGVRQDDLTRLVFTRTQADFGNRYYAVEGCDTCHGANLQGLATNSVNALAPAIIGEAFAEDWFDRTVWDLYFYVMQHPGGMADNLIPLIVAYILQQNGFQPGNTEMPRDRETLDAMGFWQ